MRQAGFHLAGIVGGVIGFKLHVGHAGLLVGALHAHRLYVEGVARLQHHLGHAVDLVFPTMSIICSMRPSLGDMTEQLICR